MNPERSLNETRAIAAEMLAYSVGKLFPNVLFFGGGFTKHGFYYDFIFEQAPYSEMLTLIDVNNRTLVKEDIAIRPLSMMRENAVSLFNHRNQPFLAEKAANEDLNVIDLVQINDFYGLCSSSAMTSAEIGSVKLLDMTEKVVVTPEGEITVTRLTGTAFPNPMALKKFVKSYDALIKKRDHRHLGVELDLFSFSSHSGTIQPVWHPKGTLFKQILKDWLASKEKGVEIHKVESPTAIEWSPFKNQPGLIEFSFEDNPYCLAPSFLPNHLYLLKNSKYYGEVLRFLEYGTVFQEVAESQLWGLFCSHSYQTDLMTVRCLKGQVLGQVISCLQFIEQNIRIFGFEAHWYLIGSKPRTPKAKLEKEAIEQLTRVASEYSFHYPLIPGIQEEENLLGPRLELRLLDEIGREWPGPAVTLVTQDALDDTVIARTMWGSLDRFVALLIERFEGEFPLWLAPEQVRILAVGQTTAYATTVYESCKKRGLRVGIDFRDEKLGLKIHTAEKEKIPYVVIVGDQEVKKQCVTVRSIKQPGNSDAVKVDQFLDQIPLELDRGLNNEEKVS